MNISDRLFAGVSAGILVVASAQLAHAGVNVVPEPATLTLVGTGAAVVSLVAWWRNRK